MIFTPVFLGMRKCLPGFLMVLSGVSSALSLPVLAQAPAATTQADQEKAKQAAQTEKKQQDKKAEEKKQQDKKSSNADSAGKTFKAEDLVERAILAYGSRPVMQAIQKNGTIRANVKFYTADGAREGRTISKFIRKEKLGEDLRLLDLELPGTRYLLGFDGKQTWSINNGEIIQPAEETTKAFHSAHEHSYEALLRYKENDGKLEVLGQNKVATIDLDIIELTLPSGAKTRFEISRRTGRVIYINYEEKPSPEAAPVKYRLYFTNFRPMQNTLVPYDVKVYADDKLIEERHVVEVAYNVQMEDKAFLSENALKSPSEPEKQ